MLSLPIFAPLLLCFMSSPVASGQPDVFNVKDFGAVGDGFTDDRMAIQSAIDALVKNGGGDLYFPPSDYALSSYHASPHGWTMLLIHFSEPNKKTVRIIGRGATLRQRTPPKGNMLSIFGGIYGRTDSWKMADYNVRSLEITGLTFVGTRIPDDRDIEATTDGTQLYLSWVQNAQIHDNLFVNTVGAGVFFFGRQLDIHDNLFVNANGGAQGADSQDVALSRNVFRCDVKCDDQLGIFGNQTTSRSVLMDGNIVDKGYDTRGSSGTQRGWGNGITISGDSEGVAIRHNLIRNLNSNHHLDRRERNALHGIKFYTTHGVPHEIHIEDNRFDNLRFGIGGTAAEVRIDSNLFDRIEGSAIFVRPVDATSTVSNWAITKNVFRDVQESSTDGAHTIRFESPRNLRLDGNVFINAGGISVVSVSGPLGAKSRPISDTVYVEGNVFRLRPDFDGRAVLRALGISNLVVRRNDVNATCSTARFEHADGEASQRERRLSLTSFELCPYPLSISQ